MAAKKKSKKKNVPMKTAGKGHNSGDASRDAELVKIAKAQRSLDNERTKVRAEWKTRQDALTMRLEDAGQSRDSFKEPYKKFCALADAADDDEAQKIFEDNKIFLAKQRIAFDALSQGEQTDWVSLIQDAEEIEELRAKTEQEEEEAEAAAAAEAAAGGDDAANTESVH